jgi:hypothetical protein
MNSWRYFRELRKGEVRRIPLLGTWVNSALLRFCNLQPWGRRRPGARGLVGPQPNVAEVEYGGLVPCKLHVVEREREALGIWRHLVDDPSVLA